MHSILQGFPNLVGPIHMRAGTKGPLLHQDDDLPGQHGRFHRYLITTHDTAPPKILLPAYAHTTIATFCYSWCYFFMTTMSVRVASCM